MVRILFSTLACLLSAVLLVLAFPPYECSWLAWIALVPLLVVMERRSAAAVFSLCFLCGVVFFTGIFLWIFELPGYRFLHHVIIGLYLGPLVGLLGLAFHLLRRRLGMLCALVSASFIWVSLEYIRSNLFFVSLPWALLAHSQYRNLTLIQTASFTGAYGISFLIFLVNATVAFFFSHHRFGSKGPDNGRWKSMGMGKLLLGVTALLFFLNLGYGFLTLSHPPSGEELRTTVIQGNIDRTMKSDPRSHTEAIMAKYRALTSASRKDKAQLTLWPEAATPGFVLKSLPLRNEIVSFVRETDSFFLIGSSEYPKFAKKEIKTSDIGNTALFFSPTGKVIGQYLKMRLVPFGEYLPLKEQFPWPEFIVPEGKTNFEIPGTEYTLFQIHDAKFGCVICWEIVFPDLFRKFVKEGANFMVNLTNEGWFGETAAPYQMLSMSVFRSVENGVSMARAANTGISCFIDPQGRVTGRVSKNGKDIFVDGHLTQGVLLSRQKTFYTEYGDVFAYLAMATAAGLLILGVFTRP